MIFDRYFKIANPNAWNGFMYCHERIHAKAAPQPNHPHATVIEGQSVIVQAVEQPSFQHTQGQRIVHVEGLPLLPGVVYVDQAEFDQYMQDRTAAMTQRKGAPV